MNRGNQAVLIIYNTGCNKNIYYAFVAIGFSFHRCFFDAKSPNF